MWFNLGCYLPDWMQWMGRGRTREQIVHLYWNNPHMAPSQWQYWTTIEMEARMRVAPYGSHCIIADCLTKQTWINNKWNVPLSDWYPFISTWAHCFPFSTHKFIIPWHLFIHGKVASKLNSGIYWWLELNTLQKKYDRVSSCVHIVYIIQKHNKKEHIQSSQRHMPQTRVGHCNNRSNYNSYFVDMWHTV
jgi:hypothetical protein